MAGQPPVVVVVPGGEFAVAYHDRRHARSKRALLLPLPLPVFLLLWFRLRCPARQREGRAAGLFSGIVVVSLTRRAKIEGEKKFCDVSSIRFLLRSSIIRNPVCRNIHFFPFS